MMMTLEMAMKLISIVGIAQSVGTFLLLRRRTGLGISIQVVCSLVLAAIFLAAAGVPM